MKSIYLFVFSILLFSCEKTGSNCQNIQDARAAIDGPVTIGEDLRIHTHEVGGNRIYSWRGPNNFMSSAPEFLISDVKLENEGWYYLALSNNECDTRVDSVYADIKLQQGTPPCSVTSNTCTFNNLANDSYSSVAKQYNPTFQFLMLEGWGSSSLEINFHPHWGPLEPEDGIYETVDVPSFGIDRNYNKVFISTVKSNIYFACHERQKVYVSHVNGKLQVRFCSLTMGGSNGANSFTTIASGNLIQQ